MVCPPTFNAATPVGASTTNFFLVCCVKCLSRVDFPVPALPVINTLVFVLFKRSRVVLNSLVTTSFGDAPFLEAAFFFGVVFFVAKGDGASIDNTILIIYFEFS